MIALKENDLDRHQFIEDMRVRIGKIHSAKLKCKP
jgi:hypothetical protein